jgi:O-methyltransferase involved in polyketide biosynthesis
VARDGAGPQMIRLRKQIPGGNPSEVSSTARYMALFRALETARGRSGLFQDPSPRIFLPPEIERVARIASHRRAADANHPKIGSWL